MLAAQRREVILDVVRRTGAARVSELTSALGVSDMTVRRDLDLLAREGRLEKVHGGARAGSSSFEPAFEAKALGERAEKLAVAQAAAQLAEPGSAVGISAGTTTWTLAHHLRQVPRLTVVTNSMEVADVLHQDPGEDQTVVLTGGMRTRSGALVGPVAIRSLADLHLDVVFMGVHGMHEETGFTTPNLMEADTDRALISAARRMVVVADHTKWGVIGISSFARLEDAAVLVTDADLPDDAQEVLRRSVGELVIACPGSEPAEHA